MKLKRFNFILLIILLTFIGCTVTTEKFIENDEILILHQIKYGENYQTKINPDSYHYRMLNKWFENNKDNWHTTSASYSAETKIEGKNFTMFILKTAVIINYKTNNGKYKQVLKEVSNSEFNFLIK